jgi:hypothetical protein
VLSVEDDPDPSTLRRVISRLVGQMARWNATMASREYDFSVELDKHGVGRLGWGDPIEWIDAEVRAT